MTSPDCQTRHADLWSCWPEAGAVPEAFLGHASACPACRGELDEFRAFCAAGAPALASVLAPRRFDRLAAKTRAALIRPPTRAPRWVPAMALAAAALCLWSLGPVKRRADLPPAEVLENLEFFEQLDLFENWEAPKP